MIRWDLISKAISWYEDYGFKYIDVPWTVSDTAMKITSPPECRLFDVDNLKLVASAEQSFIQMMLDDKLSPGKYVAASPCFRDDTIDELHKRYFFKVELIDCSNLCTSEEIIKKSLEEMINAANCFYFNLFFSYRHDFKNNQSLLTVEDTDLGKDLCFKGIELGSYGYRQMEYKNWGWIYGTGFAEPRYSFVAEKVF